MQTRNRVGGAILRLKIEMFSVPCPSVKNIVFSTSLRLQLKRIKLIICKKKDSAIYLFFFRFIPDFCDMCKNPSNVSCTCCNSRFILQITSLIRLGSRCRIFLRFYEFVRGYSPAYCWSCLTLIGYWRQPVLDEYTCAVRRSSPVHNGDTVIDKPGPMHVQVVGEVDR